MSTLLHPVGPRGPGVYWLRRGVLLAAILAVILVLATQCGGGGGGKPTADKTPSPSSSPSSSPTTPAAVVACDPDTLTLTLSTDLSQYTVGQSPQLIGVVRNTGDATCTFASSPANEIWTITSGSDKIWTTKGCTDSTVTKTVKIKPGSTKKITTVWDGHRLDTGCTEGAVAQPGEYVLRAKLNGIAGKAAIFHIAST
ncbi:MAG TPA: hypothetical protein VMH41_03350 [Mycobacteriales bacterium]|nr:hypothetical protein [Mycobacteriales bacterium]